jgi:dGTP triphosphohydrolase
MFPLFSFMGEIKMSQLHSIAVNGTVYELPTMNQFSGQLQSLAQAMANTGVTAYEMTNAIMRMNEVLSRLEYHADEITAIKDDLHDLRYETENIQSGLDCRTAVLEMEISDLRSAMDAKTENPNQKDDLEISSQIVWDKEILKILEEPIKFDF